MKTGWIVALGIMMTGAAGAQTGAAPAATENAPPAKTGAPAAKAVAPAAKTNAPATKAVAPAAKTGAPATSAAPAAPSAVPAQGAAPAAQGAAPAAQGEAHPAPAATTTAPAVKAKPAPAARAPVDGDARRWRVGLGGRIPDGLLLEGSYRLSPKHTVRVGLGLPVGTTLSEEQPAEVDSFFGELTVMTPPTTVDVDVVYGPTLALDYVHFPGATGRGLFLSGGLLYYRATAKAEKSSVLFICVDGSVACTPETARYVTTSRVHVTADLLTTGYKARVGAGWRWTLGERGFLDLTALGLAATLSVKRTSTVESGLDDDPALTTITKEQARYVLDQKEVKLEAKARSQMERVDRKLLPFAGVVVGYGF